MARRQVGAVTPTVNLGWTVAGGSRRWPTSSLSSTARAILSCRRSALRTDHPNLLSFFSRRKGSAELVTQEATAADGKSMGFKRILHPGAGACDGRLDSNRTASRGWGRTTTSQSCFTWFGEGRSARPRVVRSDKRTDCLRGVREAASQARHLPDQFHSVLVFTKRAETWSPGKAYHGPDAREPPGEPGGHCRRAVGPSAGQLVR